MHVEFFIVSLDDTTKGFFAAMERAIQRGVVVRVLLDHISTRTLGHAQGDVRRARPHRREVELHAPRAAVQGQVPATRPAQPPQDRRRRRPGGLHRLAEPHRPQLQLAEQPQARAAVAGARRPGRRPDGDGAQRGVPLRLVRRDRRAARRRRERARVDRAGRHLARRARLPDRAERSGVRGREQPPAVPLARELRTGARDHHQSVLRSRRGNDVRDHVGPAARPRRAAVRVGDRRPGLGLARPALLLRRAAPRGRAHLAVSPARTSCTPSTSRSTTTSR